MPFLVHKKLSIVFKVSNLQFWTTICTWLTQNGWKSVEKFGCYTYRTYYALPAPWHTIQVSSHWLSQNLAGQVWCCRTAWKTEFFQFFIFSWQKKGKLNWVPRRTYTNFFVAKNFVEGVQSKTHRVCWGTGRAWYSWPKGHLWVDFDPKKIQVWWDEPVNIQGTHRLVIHIPKSFMHYSIQCFVHKSLCTESVSGNCCIMRFVHYHYMYALWECQLYTRMDCNRMAPECSYWNGW